MVAALVGTLLISGNTQAAILGINTPGTSIATVNFDDTNSIAPPNGVTNTGPSVSPWNGSTVVLPLTTDPNTSDFAKGSVVGSFIPSSNTYSLNFNSITESQTAGNTGFADLVFTFNIEYQLDGAGLPLQATLFPNFVVNGTVQNSSGSFAAVSGFINYAGVNTAGTISVLETVNYNSVWNTPGPFSGTAVGIPVNGFTPALVGNTTLTLDGSIRFRVDPAIINAQSVAAPEPSTCVLGALGALGLLAFARRRRPAN
jgi:MYXO-CTERM domain-containing protein